MDHPASMWDNWRIETAALLSFFRNYFNFNILRSHKKGY